MNNDLLNRYVLLIKRWMWIVILGVIVCGGSTYIAARLIRPTYQATTYLILTVGASQSAYDNATASLELQSTYSQLITKPQVLAPLTSKYHLTLEQLTGMITVKPQSNSQFIEVDVTDSDAQRAALIANDIAQSLAQFSISRLNGVVQVNILPALQPTAPIRPRPAIDALLGALVGLGLALSLIVVFEWMDDRIYNPEEVQQKLGMEVLSIIPALSHAQKMQKAEDIPAFAEGCRILCARLAMLHRHKPCKLIMITSALAGEGKSTIAANLASFLAQTGKRVLLVDANLRHPMLHQHFQITNGKGFANIFFEAWQHGTGVLNGQATEIPSLRILTAGMLPANPTEMLQAPLAQQLLQQLREAQEFDHIIFDTPPALPVADAQILALYVDTAILVMDSTKTPCKILERAMHILRKTGTNVSGIVLNKSQWPEYGDIRDYLNSLQREHSGAKFSASSTEKLVTRSSNGKVADDTTLSLPAQRKKGE